MIIIKTIIIGGVAAGMSAAAKLKRLDPNHMIHVYEKGKDLSYSGCGMPYYLGDVVEDENQLIARYQKDFIKQGIDVFLLHEVISVNPKEKTLEILNLKTNETFMDTYDNLVIGTGTTANRTNVKGSKQANLYVLNQLPDMKKIKPEVISGKHVAIIGGGYIGVEVADNLAQQGLIVHIIQRGDQLLNVYDKDVAIKAKDALEQIGVNIHFNENLITYEQINNKTIVKTNKSSYKVDFVIEAIGVRPNTTFLKDIGLDMMDNGSILINEYCETSIKDIYAAGDCAAYYHQISKKHVYVPLGTHANKTGRIVALNIAGIKTSFPGIVGSNIIKVGKIAFAKTGLGIDEANKLNFDYGYVDITAKHQTSYYPGASDLFIRMVYDKETGILKGAQLVGEKGVSDRINIVALAVTKGLTASEFSKLDFAYAPPFSPVWDPLLIAANKIKV